MTMSRKVQNLRRQYLATRSRLATQQKLAEAIQKEMQEVCPHSVVVGVAGWGGSRAMDYDDATKEERFCCVCGFYEYGKPVGSHTCGCGEEGWEFQVLTNKPEWSAYFNNFNNRPKFLDTHRLEDTPPLDEIVKLIRIKK